MFGFFVSIAFENRFRLDVEDFGVEPRIPRVEFLVELGEALLSLWLLIYEECEAGLVLGLELLPASLFLVTWLPRDN